MSGEYSSGVLEIAGGYARQIKSGGLSSETVARKLQVSTKSREAVFKIGKRYAGSRASAKNMVDYISRDGDLELLDQDGNPVQTDEEREWLLDDWSDSFTDRAKPRIAAHMIISAPEGSSVADVKKASKEWGRESLSEYDYVQVTHTDEPHPHTHFIVARRPGGPRLSFGPKDIRKMKDCWAKIGSRNNIPMVSSSRLERGKTRKSLKQRDIHIRNRDGYTKSDLFAANEVLSEATADGGNPWSNDLQQRLINERGEYEEVAKGLQKMMIAERSKAKRTKIEQTLKLVKRQAMALRQVITRRDIMRAVVDDPNFPAITIRSTPEELARAYAKGDTKLWRVVTPANDKVVRDEIAKISDLGAKNLTSRKRERQKDRDIDRDFGIGD